VTTPNAKEVEIDRRSRRRPRTLVTALVAMVVMVATAFPFIASPAAAASIPAAYDQTYRPQFHFSPAKN
jgi:hypothetical protein